MGKINFEMVQQNQRLIELLEEVGLRSVLKRFLITILEGHNITGERFSKGMEDARQYCELLKIQEARRLKDGDEKNRTPRDDLGPKF